MATKYPWTGTGPADDKLAHAAVSGEILAAIPELAELSHSGRIEAALAEIFNRMTGVLIGAIFLNASDAGGANYDLVGPTSAIAGGNPGPSLRIFPFRGTYASPQALQAGDGIGSVQYFGGAAESVRIVSEVVDVGAEPRAARYRAFLCRVAGQAMTEVWRLDGSVTANDTALLVYDVNSGTLKRVSVGAADSGGAGFRVLRIPN